MHFYQAWCDWSVHAVYIGLLQHFLLCVRIVACMASFAFYLKLGYLLSLITFHLVVICNTMDLCVGGLADAAKTSFWLSSARDAIVAPSRDTAAPEGHGATIASEELVKRASLVYPFWSHTESFAVVKQKRAGEPLQIKADIESRIIADAPMIDTKSSLVSRKASSFVVGKLVRRWQIAAWYTESNTLQFSRSWRRILSFVIAEWAVAASDASDTSGMPPLVDSSSGGDDYAVDASDTSSETTDDDSTFG